MRLQHLLDVIRHRVRQDRVVIYGHARVEWQKDGLTDQDVRNTILNGEIIENYLPERPRVLFFCMTPDRLPVHVLVDLGDADETRGFKQKVPSTVFIVTAYIPDASDWIGYHHRRNNLKK